MSESLTCAEADVAAAIDAVLPSGLPERALTTAIRLATSIMNAVLTSPGIGSKDVADLVAVGWDLHGSMEFDEIASGKSHQKCREFARDLIAAQAKLYSQEKAGGSLPPNTFHVTRYHDAISAPGLFTGTIGAQAARLAGVWLIALSDPTLKDAPRELLQVATR